MKRIAIVFILAILVPAVLLAILAMRSLRDQELIVNTQRTELYQSDCVALAGDINLFMDDVRIFHGRLVDEIVENRPAGEVTEEFGDFIRENWGQALTGAVVDASGEIVLPLRGESSITDRFLENHAAFLENRRVVEVYEAPELLQENIQIVEEERSAEPATARTEKPEASVSTFDTAKVAQGKKRKVTVFEDKVTENRLSLPTFSPVPKREEGNAEFDTESEEQLEQNYSVRNVMPTQQQSYSQLAEPVFSEDHGVGAIDNFSQLRWSSVKSEDLTARQSEGAISRIIDGNLHVLLWKRPQRLPRYTFWTELDMEIIESDLVGLFQNSSKSSGRNEISLALLDSDGDLVGQTVESFSTDWSKPFVAAEVGQILPRWEVAAYLLDPAILDQSASAARFTFGLFILILLGAVSVGTVLILRSVNYEMRLASQKTDFVSNVSHELKTPLTSIRMFSELLERDQGANPERTVEYSSVISKEASRLTRLINRLLDFSRLDRGEMKLNCESIDLGALVQETIENHRPQIEGEGFTLSLSLPDPDARAIVRGDSDALSQVVLNLISNAEKYAREGKVIDVEVVPPTEEVVAFSVSDRGPGISRTVQRRIFEKFFRGDESISSGIEGSGIGLALSRQIIELHGGSIRYERRDGGGSRFMVELPLEEKS